MSEWTVDTLAAHVHALREADQNAIRLTISAQQEAIRKADSASEKRFDAVNEFRSTLADQQRTLMPRVEAEVRLAAIEKMLDDLSTRLTLVDGKSRGFSGGWAVAVGVLGIVSLVVGLFLALRR